MDRSTLRNDLAQLWLEVDLVQSLYFEPGRTAYRTAMAEVGVTAPVTADPTQVAFSDDLVADIAGMDTASDAELAVIVADSIVLVLTALGDDIAGSERGIRLFERLCVSVLPTIEGLSVERVQQRAQREQLTRILNLAAFYQLARAVTEHNYQDKQSAHDNRMNFSRIGLQLQQNYSAVDAVGLYDQVSKLTAIVGQAFRDFADELRPVGYYNTPQDVSVLTVAWNIYQDPTWVDDLVARNHNVASIILKQPVEYLTPAPGDRVAR